MPEMDGIELLHAIRGERRAVLAAGRDGHRRRAARRTGSVGSRQAPTRTSSRTSSTSGPWSRPSSACSLDERGGRQNAGARVRRVPGLCRGPCALPRSEPGSWRSRACARPAEAAVDALARLSPDLVMIDLELPGIGASKRSRRSCGHVPVPIVVVSDRAGRGSDPDRQGACRRGRRGAAKGRSCDSTILPARPRWRCDTASGVSPATRPGQRVRPPSPAQGSGLRAREQRWSGSARPPEARRRSS